MCIRFQSISSATDVSLFCTEKQLTDKLITEYKKNNKVVSYHSISKQHQQQEQMLDSKQSNSLSASVYNLNNSTMPTQASLAIELELAEEEWNEIMALENKDFKSVHLDSSILESQYQPPSPKPYQNRRQVESKALISTMLSPTYVELMSSTTAFNPRDAQLKQLQTKRCQYEQNKDLEYRLRAASIAVDSIPKVDYYPTTELAKIISSTGSSTSLSMNSRNKNSTANLLQYDQQLLEQYEIELKRAMSSAKKGNIGALYQYFSESPYFNAIPTAQSDNNDMENQDIYYSQSENGFEVKRDDDIDIPNENVNNVEDTDANIPVNNRWLDESVDLQESVYIYENNSNMNEINANAASDEGLDINEDESFELAYEPPSDNVSLENVIYNDLKSSTDTSPLFSNLKSHEINILSDKLSENEVSDDILDYTQFSKVPKADEDTENNESSNYAIIGISSDSNYDIGDSSAKLFVGNENNNENITVAETATADTNYTEDFEQLAMSPSHEALQTNDQTDLQNFNDLNQDSNILIEDDADNIENESTGNAAEEDLKEVSITEEVKFVDENIKPAELESNFTNNQTGLVLGCTVILLPSLSKNVKSRQKKKAFKEKQPKSEGIMYKPHAVVAELSTKASSPIKKELKVDSTSKQSVSSKAFKVGVSPTSVQAITPLPKPSPNLTQKSSSKTTQVVSKTNLSTTSSPVSGKSKGKLNKPRENKSTSYNKTVISFSDSQEPVESSKATSEVKVLVVDSDSGAINVNQVIQNLLHESVNKVTQMMSAVNSPDNVILPAKQWDSTASEQATVVGDVQSPMSINVANLSQTESPTSFEHDTSPIASIDLTVVQIPSVPIINQVEIQDNSSQSNAEITQCQQSQEISLENASRLEVTPKTLENLIELPMEDLINTLVTDTSEAVSLSGEKMFL